MRISLKGKILEEAVLVPFYKIIEGRRNDPRCLTLSYEINLLHC